MNNFKKVINSNRVLSSEQKALLLADPALPEAYQKKVAALLADFDKHSKEREAYLRDKLEKLHTEFIQQIDASEVSENEKKELLEKAKQMSSSFFRA